MEKLSEMAKEELKTRVSGMTPEEMEIFDKLAKYEDLEEAGELIRKQDLVNYVKEGYLIFGIPGLYKMFDKVAKEFRLE